MSTGVAEIAREHEGSVVTPSMVIGEPMQRSAEYARDVESFRRFRQDAEQELLPEAEALTGGNPTEVVEQPMGNPITRNADRRKEVRPERKYRGRWICRKWTSTVCGNTMARPEVTQTGGSRAGNPEVMGPKEY
ncbi:hypothetical protein B0H12DRAFT_1082619 [Mycena haematopus]|nr:hypothetical protein B0H12DRAFT_1082619 [Mycena haematopus]